MAKTKGLPKKEIRRVIKKIEPDLKELLNLLAQADDDDESVVEEIIENGVRNLLIAKKIIKERMK